MLQREILEQTCAEDVLFRAQESSSILPDFFIGLLVSGATKCKQFWDQNHTEKCTAKKWLIFESLSNEFTHDGFRNLSE